MKQNIFAVLAAFIWGTAFVAQSVSADSVSPFTFNAARSYVAAAVLLVVSAVMTGVKKKNGKTVPSGNRKQLWVGGILCGIFLWAASFLQQAGLSETSAGKAGFITALYIVIVPVFGIFIGKRAPLSVWFSVLIAVAGLYLLCVKNGFSIGKSDTLVMLCAVIFAVHILIIDHFTQIVDGVKMSCIQFAVTAVLSTLGMLLFEKIDINSVLNCIWPILYVGVFSSGVAYTLQILAQKDSNPTVISLLLSLEALFSVISGALILGDRMSSKEYIGCLLMLIAVVLAQIPIKPLLKKHENANVEINR